jgi:hypothetical protein
MHVVGETCDVTQTYLRPALGHVDLKLECQGFVAHRRPSPTTCMRPLLEPSRVAVTKGRTIARRMVYILANRCVICTG